MVERETNSIIRTLQAKQETIKEGYKTSSQF
jgi:hypothetical protein